MVSQRQQRTVDGVRLEVHQHLPRELRPRHLLRVVTCSPLSAKPFLIIVMNVTTETWGTYGSSASADRVSTGGSAGGFSGYNGYSRQWSADPWPVYAPIRGRVRCRARQQPRRRHLERHGRA